jgi:hypothetical protein
LRDARPRLAPVSTNATFTPWPLVAVRVAGIELEGRLAIVFDQSKEIGMIRFDLVLLK